MNGTSLLKLWTKKSLNQINCSKTKTKLGILLVISVRIIFKIEHLLQKYNVWMTCEECLWYFNYSLHSLKSWVSRVFFFCFQMNDILISTFSVHRLLRLNGESINNSRRGGSSNQFIFKNEDTGWSRGVTPWNSRGYEAEEGSWERSWNWLWWRIDSFYIFIWDNE